MPRNISTKALPVQRSLLLLQKPGQQKVLLTVPFKSFIFHQWWKKGWWWWWWWWWRWIWHCLTLCPKNSYVPLFRDRMGPRRLTKTAIGIALVCSSKGQDSYTLEWCRCGRHISREGALINTKPASRRGPHKFQRLNQTICNGSILGQTRVKATVGHQPKVITQGQTYM